MLVFLGYVIAALGVLAIALALFVWKQGDAEFFFDVSQRSSLVLEKETQESVVLSFRLPFKNRGSQQGTLMDVFARPWLPFEQFSAAELTTKVTIASNPRDDGYWEAALFPMEKIDNDVAIVKLRFDATNGDIRQAMKQMVDLHLNIMYQIVGRGDWYLAKTMLTLPAEEFAAAMQQDSGQK
mgnify:CR=1 FL=1